MNYHYFPESSREITNILGQNQKQFDFAMLFPQLYCFFPLEYRVYKRTTRCSYTLPRPFSLLVLFHKEERRLEPCRKGWQRSVGIPGLHVYPLGTMTTWAFLAGLARTRDMPTTSKGQRQLFFTRAVFFRE